MRRRRRMRGTCTSLAATQSAPLMATQTAPPGRGRPDALSLACWSPDGRIGRTLLSLLANDGINGENVLKPHLKTTTWTLLRANASQPEIERVTGISRHPIRTYQQRFA